MTPDEKHRQYYNDEYKRGWNDRGEHNNPSLKTFEMFNGIAESLGEIKGELKGINQRLDTQNGSIKKYGERINCLETFRDTMVGKISVIAVVFGLIGSVVLSIVNSFFKK
jgi:hypothetical protein